MLGDLAAAHWQGGSIGDDRVPGPSTYFIRAVLTLAPADLARLTSRYPFATAAAGPEVPVALQPFVGSGRWSRSEDADRALSTAGWSAELYLQPESSTGYLSVMSQ